jgi:hypothetical protein
MPRHDRLVVKQLEELGRRVMCTAKAVPESITMSDEAKDAILGDLEASGPSRPTELLSRLGERFTDFEIKEAVLRLLREGAVVLSSDRQLTKAA